MMMRKVWGVCLLLLALMVLPVLTAETVQAASPTLLKRTVSITARRWGRYWKNPKAAEPNYDTWCWTPKVTFEILGPIEAGSQLQTEISLPDGKPWMTLDMRTPELQEDYVETIKMVDVDDDTMEKRGITNQTGLFPFKIVLKNELQGTNEVLMSGKFKIATYQPDQKIETFKGKREFYVDHDWMLPIGYVWLNPRIDEDAPPLTTLMTFKGRDGLREMKGYLFYNGKKIAEASGDAQDSRDNSTGEKQTVYYNWQMGFINVRGFNRSNYPGNYSSSLFYLDKNPGQYEIKVLVGGELARSLSFSVGNDGKIVDNGVVKNNKIGGVRFIMPVKVIDEPAWDMNAWQTGAFYGNPLAGFMP